LPSAVRPHTHVQSALHQPLVPEIRAELRRLRLSEDFDSRAAAKLVEKVFAMSPGQAEGHQHGGILHFLAAFIDRESLVVFHKFALVIVNLLPESQGGLSSVHFFEVAGAPAQSTGTLRLVTPSAAKKFVPGTFVWPDCTGSSALWIPRPSSIGQSEGGFRTHSGMSLAAGRGRGILTP
jgi:hypothetical protein